LTMAYKSLQSEIIRYMRTTIIFCFILMAFLVGNGQSCPQDTIVPHTPMVIDMDASPPLCYDQGCKIELCHYTAIVDTGSFVVNFGNTGNMFEVSVVSDCRWMLFNTCTKIGSGTPSFEMHNYFTGNEQLMICGPTAAMLMVFTKHVPEMNYPPFGIPILDLDTVCGPLNPITGPSAGEPRAYMDIYTFKTTYQQPLSAGIYIELDRATLLPTGRKKICVLE